jgi:hypothetical protein
MQLQETLDLIKRYLNSPESIYTLDGRVDTFKQAISFIQEGFDLLKDNKPAYPGKEIMNVISNVMKILRTSIVTKTINNEFKEFVITFSLLIKNWNDNTIKSQDLEMDAIALNNYVKYHFTTLELFSHIKQLMEHIKKIQLTSHAPIDLSKHFLASLDAKIDNLKPGDPVDKPQEIISRREFKASNNSLIEVTPPGVGCETK